MRSMLSFPIALVLVLSVACKGEDPVKLDLLSYDPIATTNIGTAKKLRDKFSFIMQSAGGRSEIEVIAIGTKLAALSSQPCRANTGRPCGLPKRRPAMRPRWPSKPTAFTSAPHGRPAPHSAPRHGRVHRSRR